MHIYSTTTIEQLLVECPDRIADALRERIAATVDDGEMDRLETKLREALTANRNLTTRLAEMQLLLDEARL